VDAVLHALFAADYPYLMAPSLVSMPLVFGLVPWAPWAMLLALWERPPVRHRALLANGGFLLVTAAVFAAAVL
jgi:hypothetical protein